MSVRILIGDCVKRMRDLPDASVDSVVCDPPYHLTSIVKRFGAENAAPAKVGKTGAYARASKGFMGQTWDGGDVAFRAETWAEVLRVLKPGGHLAAFSGTRTYHRMVCAIEDAGFEIRDQLAWLYGSGFPKSHDVSKQIDKAAGAEREVVGFDASKFRLNQDKHLLSGQPGGGGKFKADNGATITAPATDAAREWQGWGTALKPAWEPICLARKPLIGTVAANVLEHGTGAINIDGCRIGTDVVGWAGARGGSEDQTQPKGRNYRMGEGEARPVEGRWPANIVHDGSDEVLAGFPETADSPSGLITQGGDHFSIGSNAKTRGTKFQGHGDTGSAARFFYCAKATSAERGEGNNHPTVKPVALMRWLARLITPKGGTVLDPFMGSGSTGLAADAEGFNFIGCELSAEYAAIAEKRIADAAGMFADIQVAA